MAHESLTSARAETLFDVERELRDAAVGYAAQQNHVNRKALRDAALAYADYASHLDELAEPKEES